MSEPLFCPFCEECLEDQTRCPDHDLPLVSFSELERVKATQALAADEPLPAYSFRLGRGFLFVGAALWALGFALPFLDFGEGAPPASGFALATARALNLWMVPTLAAAMMGVLARRTTPESMKSARVAVVVLALGVGASLAVTLYRVFRGVEVLGHNLGREMHVQVLIGPYLIGLGVVIALVGAIRFGVSSAKAARYRVD